MQLRYVWLLAVPLAIGLSAAGNSRVVDAVKAGDRDALRALLRQRADPNAAERDGTTALHWAVRADDLDTTLMLIRAGANVNAANRYAITPLSIAATNANAPLVEALLKSGANANSEGPDGETALMTAARAGNPDIVRALIARGASANATERWQGQTALMWAATENNAAAVKVLLDHGADPAIRSKQLTFLDYRYETNGMAVFQLPKGGWTALMYAARENAMDAVAAMADLKVDLNATSQPEGSTALQLAIINVHYDLARLLLDKGADPNVPDSTGMTALYAAVDMRAPANMLTRPEPKPHDSIDTLGLVKVLLAHHADPNARLKKPIIGRHQNLVGDASLAEGATPLARASKACDIPVMRLLLDAGADATLTLKDRTTTAMMAANGAPEPKALEALQLLVDHGVDVNAFNANGQTILHNAAGRGANSIVEYVAGKGAKLDRRDKQNRTALDVALGLGGGGRRGAGAGRGRGGQANEQTAALLRELMAKKGLATPPAPSDAK